MGPTWVLSAPDGPHVGPTKLAIREVTLSQFQHRACTAGQQIMINIQPLVSSDLHEPPAGHRGPGP